MAPTPISHERPLLILARLVAVLFLGGWLTLWGVEWVLSSSIFSPFLVVALIPFPGLLPLGFILQRRHRLAGIRYWLILLLNLVSFGGWFLFHLDIQGPLLGLDLVFLLAALSGPSSRTRWLAVSGYGLASGVGVVLSLWVFSSLFLPGLVSGGVVGSILLITTFAGLVGEVVRRAVEGNPLFVSGARPSEALPTRIAQHLSRRRVVFGLAGLLGMAVTGAGATWLIRSVLVHVRPLLTYQSPEGAVTALSWSPDGRLIVSANGPNGVRVWETTTGNTLRAGDQEQEIAALAWSPDGTRIALGVSGAFDPQNPNLFIVDAATLQAQVSLHADNFGVSSVAWSPDSTRLAVAAFRAQVWEASTGKVLLTTAAFAGQVAWSPNGQYLATCDVEGPPLVWEASRGTLLITYRGHVGAVSALSWSPDSRFLASAGDDGTVQVWDASTGQHVFTYRGHGASSIALVAWSPHKSRIASSDGFGNIHVWEATSGDHLFVFQAQHWPVFVIAWSPDGTRIASGGVLGQVEIWQPE